MVNMINNERREEKKVAPASVFFPAARRDLMYNLISLYEEAIGAETIYHFCSLLWEKSSLFLVFFPCASSVEWKYNVMTVGKAQQSESFFRSVGNQLFEI